LVFEVGRASISRTTSPVWASLFSSCARTLAVRRTIFSYFGWRRTISSRTVMVLSALSETTVPWRTALVPGTPSAGGVPVPGVRLARSAARRARRSHVAAVD
jgi:hypothetical protein